MSLRLCAFARNKIKLKTNSDIFCKKSDRYNYSSDEKIKYDRIK